MFRSISYFLRIINILFILYVCFDCLYFTVNPTYYKNESDRCLSLRSVYRITKNARLKSSEKDSVDYITKLISVGLNLNIFVCSEMGFKFKVHV